MNDYAYGGGDILVSVFHNLQDSWEACQALLWDIHIVDWMFESNKIQLQKIENFLISADVNSFATERP